MKITTVLAGDLTRPNSLPATPDVVSNQHNVQADYNYYLHYSITTPGFEVSLINAAVSNNDTLQVQNGQKSLILLPLENTFTFKIAGFTNPITLHHRTYNIFHVPALTIESELKAKHIYALVLISLPSAILHDLPPNIESIKFLKAALLDQPVQLFSNHIIASKKIITMIKELPAQRKDHLTKSCKALATLLLEKKDTKKEEEQVHKVASYIDQNMLTKDLTIKFLAEQTKVDANTIKTKFAKYYDHTVHDYIRIKKLQVAAVLLLNKQLTIEEIAYNLRMNPSSLNRLFWEHYKLTPNKYRNQNLQKG